MGVLKNIPGKLLLALLATGICYWFLFGFLRNIEYDSAAYIGAARYLFGLKDGFDHQSRLIKPIALLFPGFLESILAIPAAFGFLIQNGICYFLCGIGAYKLFAHIFEDNAKGFLGALLYITCQPFGVYSLFVLTDTPGWAIGIWSIYWVLRYVKLTEPVQWYSLICIGLGLFAGTGCLVKESAAIGFLFLFCWVLIAHWPWSKKIAIGLTSLLSFVSVIAIVQFIIHSAFHHTFLARELELRESTHGIGYLKWQQYLRIIDVYWWLVFIGIVSIGVEWKKQIVPVRFQVILKSTGLCIGLAFLLMPLHPFCVDRIFFLTAPLLLIFAVKGLSYFSKHQLTIVIIGGTINIAMTYFIYKYNVRGMLAIGNLLFISALFLFRESKNVSL